MEILTEYDCLRRARKIFQYVDPTFFKRNARFAKVIINTFEELAKHYRFDGVQLTWRDKSAGACFDLGEMTINLNLPLLLVYPDMKDEDIIWLIYHEVGHYLDYIDGRFTYDDDHFIFDDIKIDREYISELFRQATPESHNDYNALPHEMSANIFAYTESGVAPTVDDGIYNGYLQAKEYIDNL